MRQKQDKRRTQSITISTIHRQAVEREMLLLKKSFPETYISFSATIEHIIEECLGKRDADLGKYISLREQFVGYNNKNKKQE